MRRQEGRLGQRITRECREPLQQTRGDRDGFGFQVGLARAPFPVRGRGGRTLDEAWRQGAVAYKGMTVSGFPNWFILMGPNTGPGHTSVLVYTEAQISHALQAIQKIIDEGLKYVDVRKDIQDRYNEGIQKRMKRMVWGGCQSWYLNPDGTNRSLYPGFAAEYVLRARRMNPNDYECIEYADAVADTGAVADAGAVNALPSFTPESVSSKIRA